MSDYRKSPVELNEDEFKKIGYQLIDAIASLINTMPNKQVTTDKPLDELVSLLGHYSMPEEGSSGEDIVAKSTELLTNYSLLNGHPKFMGFITSSPAPIGMLGDLLASAINANVSAQILSPIATEIEKQTIAWLCSLIGVDTSYGGLLVSGGNMANFTAFLAARTAKMPESFKQKGFIGDDSKWVVYCSKSTHTWIEKAAVIFGHGLDSIKWISTDENNKINITLLRKAINDDLENGNHPFMVVGTAGDVSTGSIDDLKGLSGICKDFNLWFHIDGAYGVPAAVLPELKDHFIGLEDADSIAIDPHKWLYAPLEAGCVLVKDSKHLTNTFSSRPEYYNFNTFNPELAHNFYEYGLQNSRGFRALKVWMTLQHAGRKGFVKMIREDISLAKLLFDLANKHPQLEAVSHNLSITTFRYTPLELANNTSINADYLNKLNESLLNELQYGGDVFLSNAIINGNYNLRACIVNFRTTKADIKQTIDIIVSKGQAIHHYLNNKDD